MSVSEKSPMRQFRYNPRWQEPGELERLYVARKPLFERLYGSLAEQGTTSVPRHHLIIGQRGMGKTTLLARLALELRQKNSDFLPLNFWEEQHVEVDRLSVFWLNCLDSMADALELGNASALAQEIDLQVRRLEMVQNEDDRSREAAQFFEEAIKRTGKRLVLFIDNFNLVIGRLKAHDHVLRGFFTRHGAPIIVGAGITPPDDIADYEAAFYDGFQTTLLHRLSLEEVQDMIRRLAEEYDERHAISAMWRELPRVSALRDLSGGNPRTCLLIYRLCVQGFTETLYRDLETLLDETTPLFQSRFEQLSDQGQKLVARLARHWYPASAETITEITGFPRGTVSPLLGRLEQEGIIEKVSLFDPKRRDLPAGKRGGLSKRLGYQIAERFFCIWLIMRSSSRRERDGVRSLSRWLECLYTPEEIQQQASVYACKPVNCLDQAVLARALAECIGGMGGGDAHDLRLSSEISLLSFARKGEGDLEGIMDENSFDSRATDFVSLRERLKKCVGPDDKVSPETFADLVLGSPSVLIKTGLSREIIAKLDAGRPFAVERLAKMLQNEREEFSEAVGIEAQSWWSNRLMQGLLHIDGDDKSLEAALFKAPNAKAKALVGAMAQRQNLYDLAEKAYLAAVTEDDDIYYAWVGLAQIYHKTNRYDLARNAYARALDVDDSSAELCSNYGQLLAIDLKQLALAEPWFRRAAELDPRDASIANNLAACLWFQEGKDNYEEAVREFRRAAALNPFEPKYHISIGNIYQHDLKDYAKAATSYRMAISMTKKAPQARTYLASLLQYCTLEYAEAERQYRKAIEDGGDDSAAWYGLGTLLARNLGRPADAVEAFENAVRMDPMFELAWTELALVRIMYLGQPEEGKKALIKVLEINPKNANALNTLGNLEYDVFANIAPAASHFEEAIAADPNVDQSRHNYIFLLRDTLGDIARAKSLFGELRQPIHWKDTQALHRALFACYEDNWGTAVEALSDALAVIEYGAFPKNTEDDWFRASAVLLKLGFGLKLLTFLEAQGCKIRMMPWFAALEAHEAGDKQMLINYPAEARPAAEKIYDEIEKRQKLIKIPAGG